MGNLRQKQSQPAKACVKEQTKSSKNSHLDPAEELQEMLGNQAFGRLIESQSHQDRSADSSPNALQRQILTANNSPMERRPLFRGLSHELMGNGQGNLVQAKLTVNQPGDKYEQEADEVAEQVVKQINAPSDDRLVQAEAIQTEKLMRKSVSSPGAVAGGMAAPPDLETSIKQKQGNGQPLSQDIREPIEQSLNNDFSSVRVHTDDQSDKLNRSIQSVAFTQGQDIFFKRGAYQPTNREGQKLLIHELTHVVQQGYPGQIIQRKPFSKIKKRDLLPAPLQLAGTESAQIKNTFEVEGYDPHKAASMAISGGEILGNGGNFIESMRDENKSTADKFVSGFKEGAGVLSGSTSIASKNLKSDSTELGVVETVSEVADGVSNLLGAFQEVKGMFEQFISDKEVSKTQIGKAIANTLANLGKTAKGGAGAASKIQGLRGAKEGATTSNSTSSIIRESVGLFESLAKSMQQLATFIEDYQNGKFSKGGTQSHRVIELFFQGGTTLASLASGGVNLGKTIGKVINNDAAKAGLGISADVIGIVTGSIQIFHSSYKISRASVKKDKLDILAAGKSEEEKKALMLIKDRLKKQQANAGINMVLASAGIVSASLSLSGVGMVPGAIIAALAAGFKVSRIGFKQFKQYMRDRSQDQYDEAVTMLTEVAREVSAKKEEREKTGKAAMVGTTTNEYLRAIDLKIESAKHKRTKDMLQSVRHDVETEKGLLLKEEQIALYMGQREYGSTLDTLKKVAGEVPADANKALGEDVKAYKKALKEQIKMAQGDTKDRLKQVLEYVDKDNPLPLKEIEILKIIEDAEVSRIGQSNIIMRQLIFSRLKSTKQKEAMYYMSAEQILNMDVDEVYTILNLSKLEIEQAAETAKTEAEKKYSDDEYKDLSEEEKQSSIQGEIAEFVKRLVVQKLKEIN